MGCHETKSNQTQRMKHTPICFGKVFIAIVTFFIIPWLFLKIFLRGYPRGVMVKAMDCGIVVSKFILQSPYYVHFRANTYSHQLCPDSVHQQQVLIKSDGLWIVRGSRESVQQYTLINMIWHINLRRLSNIENILVEEQ